MGRRKETRTAADFRQLWGTDASGVPHRIRFHQQFKCARSIAGRCARSVNPAECVGLTYADKKARFRVTWVGEVGTSEEGKVGLEMLRAAKKCGIALGKSGPDPFIPRGGPEAETISPIECGAELKCAPIELVPLTWKNGGHQPRWLLR